MKFRNAKALHPLQQQRGAADLFGIIGRAQRTIDVIDPARRTLPRLLPFSSLRANQSIQPLLKKPSAGAGVSLPLRYARPRTEAC
jgi:hypothetical protein